MHLTSTSGRDQLVNILDIVLLENALKMGRGWSHSGSAGIVVPSGPVRLCFHKPGETICADDLHHCVADGVACD